MVVINQIKEEQLMESVMEEIKLGNQMVSMELAMGFRNALTALQIHRIKEESREILLQLEGNLHRQSEVARQVQTEA